MNPNNCETCDYRKMRGEEDGWCYMFSDEPKAVCMKHTMREQEQWGMNCDIHIPLEVLK